MQEFYIAMFGRIFQVTEITYNSIIFSMNYGISILLRNFPEAATRGVLCKKVFLEISQNSQENTCVRVSFLIKLQRCRPVFSCEFCEIYKKNFFTEHLWMTASNFSIHLIVFVYL